MREFNFVLLPQLNTSPKYVNQIRFKNAKTKLSVHQCISTVAACSYPYLFQILISLIENIALTYFSILNYLRLKKGCLSIKYLLQNCSLGEKCP